MPETLLPTAMVPGLVTIKDKKGKMQNVYPIDAKELLSTGDYELVDNGAIEAARMSATPLKMAASNLSPAQVVAEVSGPSPAVVAVGDPKEAEKLRSKTAGPEGTTDQDKAPDNARAQDQKQAEKSATSGSGDKAGADKK